MRRYRIGFLIMALALAIGGGLARWRDTQPVTRAATPAATVATTPFPTPTQQHATPRPVVVTAVHTAEPTVSVETSAGLNLRDKPGGAIVGSVRQGVVLQVKIAGRWAEVTAGEHRGKFVAAAYIRPVK